jgi:hypothetical protein
LWYSGRARGLVKEFFSPGAALADPVETDVEAPEDVPVLATLRRSDRGLFLALEQGGLPAGAHVMIVVDQFEELFAFRRSGAEADRVATRDEAAGFVRLLLRSCAEPEAPIRVVVTMRSDFIGDSEAFLGLPEAISRSQFLVPRLDRAQLTEVITRPGAVRDAAFRSFTVDGDPRRSDSVAGLVTRVINDAGDRSDQLPLMEHALMRTWKIAVARAGDGAIELTREDFEKAGGLANALSLHADAAWDQVKDNPRQAHLTQRLFMLLCDVTPDGQITRRRPRITEVETVADASLDEIADVMRIFQEDDRSRRRRCQDWAKCGVLRRWI